MRVEGGNFLENPHASTEDGVRAQAPRNARFHRIVHDPENRRSHVIADDEKLPDGWKELKSFAVGDVVQTTRGLHLYKYKHTHGETDTFARGVPCEPLNSMKSDGRWGWIPWKR